MEHIPQAERPAFVAGLAARLDGDGIVIASTPHPAFTLHKRATDVATCRSSTRPWRWRGTRFAHAVRLLRAGDRASAWWFLTARTPKAES